MAFSSTEKKKERHVECANIRFVIFICQSEANEGRLKETVFRSMFVFMFRYLLQNVAKMTESTPSRHCLPWKHFMQYAYTCLQGFYVKIVYFITSYDPSFILQYLVVVLGTSRSQEIVGHFRRGRKQQALNKGKVCPIPTCSLETKREIEKGKKRRKENLGII